LVVAGHFMIPEVCLYFNYKLFRGNRATKVAASDFAAFDSPNAPPLAVTTSMRTLVNWDLVRRPTSLEHFSIRTNLDTSHVACLRIFPGIQPEMGDAVLKLDGLRGLVLETFGAGNAPGGKDNAMTKVLASAIERGIVIVNITQCLSLLPLFVFWNTELTIFNRPLRPCQPRVCPRHDTIPRRRGGRTGHDDRGGADQDGVPPSATRGDA
jgi:L-asparaginase/Glu-tRNA(Gln) amidotransferase subunit D